MLYTVHIYYKGLLHVPLIELPMISVEHLASAGFFGLLASLPFRERKNFIRFTSFVKNM